MAERSERIVIKNKPSIDFIYGTRAIIEAIRAGREFEKIFVQNNLQNELSRQMKGLARDASIPLSTVPIEKLNRITRKNHQGVIGTISPISYTSVDHIITSAYESGQQPFILILDRITDVRNFGAIARTAECAGVHGIIVPAKGSAMINSDAVKTSAGALNHILVSRISNMKNIIDDLKANGLFILACAEKSTKPIYEIHLDRPIALILGAEENGISTELLRYADDIGMLPLYGKIESLNVSVAAGILIYEVIRQRK